MNRNSTSSLGAFHPIIFFVIVYGISLFLAFFVCSTIYYNINGNNNASTVGSAGKNFSLSNTGSTATAYR